MTIQLQAVCDLFYDIKINLLVDMLSLDFDFKYDFIERINTVVNMHAEWKWAVTTTA